jgi:hypothetical protein
MADAERKIETTFVSHAAVGAKRTTFAYLLRPALHYAVCWVQVYFLLHLISNLEFLITISSLIFEYLYAPKNSELNTSL